MKTEKDILKENIHLKQMPFSTPECYFDELKSQIKVQEKCSSEHRSLLTRLSPYISLAAAFALIIAAGGFFLNRNHEMDFTEEDYIVFSDDMTNTILYGSDGLYADALTEEDIMEYIIYSDIDINELY